MPPRVLRPVRAADGGYLGQRVQESLLSGDPSEPGADARQHAIYLTAQMVTHFCGPVAVELQSSHIRQTRVCLTWTEIGPLEVSVMGASDRYSVRYRVGPL